MKVTVGAILFLVVTFCLTKAQVKNWLEIIKNTKVAVNYFSPIKSESFVLINAKDTQENELSLIKEYSDENIIVKLVFRKYESHIELFGDVINTQKENLCFTLKIIFPSNRLKNIVWSYDLDSTVIVENQNKLLSNYVNSKTIIPAAGAFNTDSSSNGGYGDKVGTGQMSFFPLASISTDKTGFSWGIDMGIPIVFRLAYDPKIGMLSEFDLAISKETKKFPNRTFFKLLLYEFNPEWNMRAALKKYYQIQSKYFKRRVTQEGIWLPFASLNRIKKWQDFGFAFHETDWRSKDSDLDPALSSIEAGKKANILTFQYTEPWEEEIPIPKFNLTYQRVIGKEIISEEHSKYFETSAALDKENKLIARKLKTPWFKTGWAVSINTNPDPDIKGFNRFDYVSKTEINPAIEMNVDGIYFDCLEWNWQYDLNYNRKHFEYTDYPLTFSSSLKEPRPTIWCYSSDYEFINRVADEMHSQGKYVMGNSFYWIPFSAGKLDLFGSELNWYDSVDTKMTRLQFLRAMAYQKPAVFLLNVGLGDKVFTQLPYDGYKIYFEKMLFYGFFPSFFSEDASNNIYWEDSVKYNIGRRFFKKYIPLIKEIAQAGWRPIPFARTNNKEIKLERFGDRESTNIYFTLYNHNSKETETSITIDTKKLDISKILQIDEIQENKKIGYTKKGNFIQLKLKVNGNSVRLIKINKQ